ncbi:hypothetical protein PUN28_017253 [Cardiocondyla obscurior]|uniref:Uncharacterized protein n=1 Tax=Cardiocondyla obscurior TaxID=286306 RepID=A0AAW2EMM3_9HYME
MSARSSRRRATRSTELRMLGATTGLELRAPGRTQSTPIVPTFLLEDGTTTKLPADSRRSNYLPPLPPPSPPLPPPPPTSPTSTGTLPTSLFVYHHHRRQRLQRR